MSGRIAFYIVPLVPALIIYVALVVVSYEPEHDVNMVRVPSWRGAHSNLAQLAQRLGYVHILFGGGCRLGG